MLKKLIFVMIAIAALIAGVWVSNSGKAELTTLQGESYQWQDFQGQWLIVNYFAEWCAPCLKEVPELNRLEQNIADTDIQLLAISWDNVTRQELAKLAHRYAMQFPLAYGIQPQALPFNKPSQLPATFILSPQGKVLKRLLGEQTSESILEQVNLLKAKVNQS